MIGLRDNNLEIGIYPGRCIEAKNDKKQSERSIKWNEVKKSPILRHLTENLMTRLTYELNGYRLYLASFCTALATQSHMEFIFLLT